MNEMVAHKRGDSGVENMADVLVNGQVMPEYMLIHEAVAYRGEIANTNTFKRFLDILITLCLFVFVFSWLFPIIAIIIKLTSKGNVFFKQERVSLNHRVIFLYKFRSMVVDSRDIDAHGKFFHLHLLLQILFCVKQVWMNYHNFGMFSKEICQLLAQDPILLH